MGSFYTNVTLKTGDVPRVRQLLGGRRKQAYGEFVFETERHERLVNALGLPRCAIATGYAYLEAGECPEGYDAGAFERIA